MFKRLILTFIAVLTLTQTLKAQSGYRDYSNIYLALADTYNLQFLQSSVPTASASAASAYYYAHYAAYFAAVRTSIQGGGNTELIDTYDYLIYAFSYYAFIYSQNAYYQTLIAGFSTADAYPAQLYSYLAYLYSAYAFWY
jgi:ammonia channel protein AmtB